MNITIRKATDSDYNDILSLIKEFALFQKTPAKVTITLEQMKNEENLFQCIVAENDQQEIVGFASYFFTYYSWSGKGMYLDDLYVKESYRKANIGSDLLNTIIGLATTQNCKKLRWQVTKWNSNAISFYKKIGAHIEETEINCELSL